MILRNVLRLLVVVAVAGGLSSCESARTWTPAASAPARSARPPRPPRAPPPPLLPPVPLALPPSATGPLVQSTVATQAVVVGEDARVAHLARVPFLIDGGPAFNWVDLHVKLTPTAQGEVMVKLRFATVPSFGYATTATTPMQLSLKSGDRILATLAPIAWDVQCFHGATFGAHLLVPKAIYGRIDAIEVAPLRATLKTCGAGPSALRRK